VRQGERWTFAQTLKNHALFGITLGALWGLAPLAFLPLRSARALGSALGRLVHSVGLGRRLTRENLSTAFPGLSSSSIRALSRRVYVGLGAYLAETLVLLARPWTCRAIPFEKGSREILDEQRAQGKGVIFASAHLGPWERVAGSLVQHGLPLTTIARETYDPRFMRIYERLRRGLGVKVIYRGHPASSTRLVRALRAGAVLGLPMDLSSRVPSIEAPFLGVPARTAVGPARIALRTGAPVVVGTAVQCDTTGLALRVTVIPTDGLSSDRVGEALLTERINDELSARIRAFPEGWLWMHPRWAPPSKGSAPQNTASEPPETR
jgi:Kdo2-lipid IVA lauroyltransferase/acyltransferase